MRGALFGVVAFLAAGVAAADGASPLDAKASGASSMSAEELVALGDLFVEAARYPEAAKAFVAALKIQKGYGEAELGKVRIEMSSGKLEKAKKSCRAVGRRHKAESVGEVCSGWVWLTFDRSARAIDEFQKAIEKGDLARGHTGLGEAYRRQMDNAKAIEEFNAALAAGARHVARIGLGLSQEANGNGVDAAASLQAAVNDEPASCLAHFHFGRLLGKGDEAAAQLRTAIAIRPGWTEAYQELGDVLLRNGDNAGAELAYKSAIESSKAPRGKAHYGLARAMYGQGRSADAKAELEKAIELVPNLVDAYLLLSDIAYASGDRDGAMDALERARTAAPGEVKVFLYSGLLYYKLERFTSANGFLVQAIGMKADLSLAHATLGDISCSRRLYDEGRAHFDDALKGDLVDISSADIVKRKAACEPKKR
jgi:tetratricopeptide (TPR) repeat protein